MTGIGPVAVRQPRVRDREAKAAPAIRRASGSLPAIPPPYARRSKSLDTLIPILYLKGVSESSATSRRRWPPCSARMVLACRLRPSRGLKDVCP